MKIAFLINSLTSGGAEKIVVTIIDELQKENKSLKTKLNRRLYCKTV